MNILGILHDLGQGVTRDYAKARKWYEKAAALGNSYAVFNLARTYEFALARIRDSDTAARLVEQALRLNNAPADSAMESGATGWSIEFRKALQARFKNVGVYSGAIDGNFGPDTLAAIDAIIGKPE